MSSEVVICNLALSRLGQSARVLSINPPDQSTEANYCAMFFSLSLRLALEEHNWSFASTRGELTLLDNNDSRWRYCYAEPADLIKVNNVFDRAASEYHQGDLQNPYTRAYHPSGVPAIYTHQSNAAIDYVFFQTNIDRFTGQFTLVAALSLSIQLAGVMLRGDTGVAAANKLRKDYQDALSIAKTHDATSRHLKTVNYTPAFIKARY